MIALSALVFALAWWMGLYLISRDPRKPVLVLAAVGLCGFALVVALDAVRGIGTGYSEALSRIEIYLVALPAIAWFAVLLELARPPDAERDHTRELILTGLVASAVLLGAVLAGSVNGPLRLGHWVMLVVISLSTLGAMVAAVRNLSPRRNARESAQPTQVAGVVVVATLFFALSNAILVIPLGLVPSWLALAATGFDILLLGIAVALWDSFDEGQALRAAMLRSFIGALLAVALLDGQLLIGTIAAKADADGTAVLTTTALLTLAIAIAATVSSGALAGRLARVAFSGSPRLRADRAALRTTEAALPLCSSSPLDGLDDETFARLTRRALGHYGDLAKLVASPLNQLPEIDVRLAQRGAPDQPLERAAELRSLLGERIDRLKPRDDGEFGTTEQWRYYNALYFPYVVGVRPYAQNATAAGLDPVARQAWQWLVTDVPQRSFHSWQNAAARLIAADLRAQTPAVRQY
ncbi:MAG: hypothetical protein KIH64_004150 [Mycobacterium sp.]|nr:hypothetical protein [Mycobacterium sp.]